MPAIVQALSLEEAGEQLIRSLGLSDKHAKDLIDELREKPEGQIKVILEEIDGVAKGKVQLSRVLTLLIQEVRSIDGILKDVKEKHEEGFKIYEKRGDLFRQLFDAYAKKVDGKKSDINTHVAKSGELTLAVFGTLQNGRTAMIETIKAEPIKAGMKASDLKKQLGKLSDILPEAQEQANTLFSKAENATDQISKLLGLVQELVDMQEKAEEKVARVKLGEKREGSTRYDTLETSSAVAVMEPAVEEAGEVSVSVEEVEPDLEAIVGALDEIDSEFGTFAAMLEDLNKDAEKLFAGYELAEA